jgi:hypothetical protein
VSARLRPASGLSAEPVIVATVVVIALTSRAQERSVRAQVEMKNLVSATQYLE